MKKLLLSAILGLAGIASFGQTEYSDFSAAGRGVATTFETDYHATGINPANLGFKRKYENKHVTFGLFEGGFSAYSNALEKKDFRQNVLNFNNSNFTFEQKVKAASQFTEAPVALNADFNWFGISYQNDKIGGFAFNIRETARWYSQFNDQFAKIAFLGYQNTSYFDQIKMSDGTIVSNDPSQYSNYISAHGEIKEGISSNPATFSQLFKGTQMSFIWYREYALSYGKEFKLSDNLALAGGLAVKYLQGFGVTQIDYRNNKITTIGAFSPVFKIDFGTATKMNPSADTTSNGLKSAGSGMGFDFGVNFYYKEKLKFGIALTNVGAISWDANVYQAQDTLLNNLGSAGFDSYNIFKEADKIISNDGFLKWQGHNKIKTQLPTTLRMGVSHQFEDKGEIGVDFIIPLNKQPGQLQKMYWALGGDFKVLSFLKLSAGVAHGGNYSTRVNIPVGITFVIGESGTWEFGVASRDAVTYFRDKGPAISVAFGFLRFRV